MKAAIQQKANELKEKLRDSYRSTYGEDIAVVGKYQVHDYLNFINQFADEKRFELTEETSEIIEKFYKSNNEGSFNLLFSDFLTLKAKASLGAEQGSAYQRSQINGAILAIVREVAIRDIVNEAVAGVVKAFRFEDRVQ